MFDTVAKILNLQILVAELFASQFARKSPRGKETLSFHCFVGYVTNVNISIHK